MSDAPHRASVEVQGPSDHAFRSVTEAVREIAGARDMPGLLKAVADGAQRLIGTHQVVASRLRHGWSDAETYVALSDKYAAWHAYDEVPKGLGVLNYVTRENLPLRLTGEELLAHPEFRHLRDAPDHPPLPDYLAAPLVGRDGSNLGLVQLADKVDGTPFCEADEALLVQLATTAAGVVEHLELSLELERNVRKHRLVADVAVAFASGTGLADMLRRTVKAIVDHLDAPLARLWLVNEDLHQLELQASAGSPADLGGVETRIPLGQGIVGEAADRCERRRTDDLGSLPEAWGADGRAVEFAAIPLTLEGRCIGVLGLSMPRPLTDNALTTLEATAETAALGIQRVRHERATGELLAREQRARHELDHAMRRVDLMHSIGRSVLRRIDVDDIVGMVIEAAVELTPAAFGAFFYNVEDEHGELLSLYRLAGADRADFAGFDMPRKTPVFAPTFNGERIVRSDDITQEPVFGLEPPYHGFPDGHLPVRSYLAVPVRLSGGEVVGGMFFAHPEPGRFGDGDEVIVTSLADYAGIAIDNARLLAAVERELALRSRILEERDRVASVLQASLLPPSLPDIPGVEVGAVYRGGQTSVGGDFYDVFPLADDDWFVVLGDVCGKGPLAAARTALARHSVRTGAVLRRRPELALGVLNRALLMDESEEQRSRFVSAIAMRLRLTGDDGDAVHVDAATGGHHGPLIRRADGRVERFEVSGTLLGVFDDVRVGSATTTLGAGDQLVLYT
ncbi:MAG: GAF domain-containing protein, partial [Acidimicrobiia bacterium]